MWLPPLSTPARYEDEIVKTAQTLRPSFWRREHHLDKMSFRELVIAYFQYPAIIAYLALSAVGVLAGGNPPAVRLLDRNDRDDSTSRSGYLAFFIDLIGEFPVEMNHCNIWTNEPFGSAFR